MILLEVAPSSEREHSPANVNLHLLQASGRLKEHIPNIERNFEQTLSRVREKIDVTDVVVYDNPRGAIPEVGIGGRAVTDHFILISLDPEFERFTEVISKQLPRSLAHELYHCLRYQELGFNRNLLQAMIDEGLADHFSYEITDLDLQPWDKALNPEQIKRFGTRALKECRNERYNHDAWFYGSSQQRFSRKPKIPRWAGYTLGHMMVEEYFKINPGTEASELYNVEAEEFYGCLEKIVEDSQTVKKE
ncbi:hypothetical protein ISS85_00780 [Candidatus Microgenomates bacterium]|nr:hypothetical protein [Candidatus Microgenomates bacterium]